MKTQGTLFLYSLSLFLLISCSGMQEKQRIETDLLNENTFRKPDKTYYPETWFHFIGGNVSKEGITADLEAIAAAGISGIQLFHGQFGGEWPGVSPQIKCLSGPKADLPLKDYGLLGPVCICREADR